MSTLEEIRYAYVWQSCTGVEFRAKAFDDWISEERGRAWGDGYDVGHYGET